MGSPRTTGNNRGLFPAAPQLPTQLQGLVDLALDLHWTWSNEANALWRKVDLEIWQRTRNPWIILRKATPAQLRALAADAGFVAELRATTERRRAVLEAPGWFAANQGRAKLKRVAYFSMEFGIGKGLPLYAGGLGILAGDVLKSASNLAVPIIGVGLLYQEGYFRQRIDAAGWQHEIYPYNEPAMLPLQPAHDRDGGWLHITLDLPGRTLILRIWKAQVGRTALYLLDSNDPLNSPADRGITAKLYGGGSERRLMQELVLGIAGWRVIEALYPDTEVCHLNEGHSAFVVLERARQLAHRTGLQFWEAFWATRAGNVFTTHTAVDAAFDRYEPTLIHKYMSYIESFASDAGISWRDLLALGRADPDNDAEPFNMAYLALRGSAYAFGVSRLHGAVSRALFKQLFPRWPTVEVPLDHITNGVHVPSWESAAADKLWTAACGEDRWRGACPDPATAIEKVDDASLWAMRNGSRQRLVECVRSRLKRSLAERGAPASTISLADGVFGPDVLTLGFARRFTAYKRTDLLLRDPLRLRRLLNNRDRPVQLVLAGKPHPDDLEGKRMVQEWILFAEDPECRAGVVFLEDYDMSLAAELVQGVDVWINMPRRRWEACGTSGMKVLVNGGLNLSVRDGWWAEVAIDGAGWFINDIDAELTPKEWDKADAESLYSLLEREIVPAFYSRDAAGLPRDWLKRVRRSMAVLTPAYSGTRLLQDYLAKAYFPGAQALRSRLASGGAAARSMAGWERRIRQHWAGLRFGDPTVMQDGDCWAFTVPVHLGEMPPADIRVELYADPIDDKPMEVIPLASGRRNGGAANGHVYTARVPNTRPARDFTPRIRPHHVGTAAAELPLILWQR